MDNCIFCKIIRGEIPSKKVFEDEQLHRLKKKKLLLKDRIAGLERQLSTGQ